MLTSDNIVSDPRASVSFDLLFLNKANMPEKAIMESRELVGNRKGICSSCEVNQARYTCPRCSISSCSVACITKHKEDSSCSGERDKTAFVTVKEYNENTLYSDYRFLEEIDRLRQSARRTIKQQTPFHIIVNRRKDVSHLAQRRGINYKQLPPTFSRMERNRTFCRNRALNWTIELIFPQSGVKFMEDSVPEGLKLESLLTRILSDPIKGQSVKLYKTTGGLDKVKVLMKTQPNAKIEKRGHRMLDNKRSLQDNLKGNYVMEFPELIVITEDKLAEYNIPGLVPATEKRKAEEGNTAGGKKIKPNEKPSEEGKGKPQEAGEKSTGEAGSSETKDDSIKKEEVVVSAEQEGASTKDLEEEGKGEVKQEKEEKEEKQEEEKKKEEQKVEVKEEEKEEEKGGAEGGQSGQSDGE